MNTATTSPLIFSAVSDRRESGRCELNSSPSDPEPRQHAAGGDEKRPVLRPGVRRQFDRLVELDSRFSALERLGHV
jgi:hypothetical protein